MTFRRAVGLKLANSGLCKVKGRVVAVPSRSKPGQVHLVNLKHDRDPRCGCKDAVVNRQMCAHIWAGRHLLERAPDDPGATERPKDTPKHYPRAWALYNRAEVEASTTALAIAQYLAIHLMSMGNEEGAA